MKNILTEALVNSATNASFIFSYTNSAKLRLYIKILVSGEEKIACDKITKYHNIIVIKFQLECLNDK